MDPSSIKHIRHPSTLYATLEYSILELAVLGRITAALRLHALATHSWGSRYLHTQTAGLYFAWASADTWPDTISADRRTEAVKREHRDLVDEHSMWPIGWEARKVDDEGALEECLKIVDENDGVRLQVSEEKDVCMALVKALDISLFLGRRDGVAGLSEQSRELVDRLARRMDRPMQLHCLSFAWRVWPLLVDGVLARAAGVQEEKLDKMVSEIEAAYQRRIRSGQESRFPASTSLEELLEMWSGSGARFGGRGASLKEVEELEHRLDVKLPSDYKTFLSLRSTLDDGRGKMLHATQAVKRVTAHKVEESQAGLLTTQLIDLWPIELWEEGKGSNWIQDDFEWPGWDGVIEVGNNSDRKVWLVGPEVVSKLRDNYRQIHERGSGEIKRLVEMAIENLAGSEEEFKQVEWCCLMWKPMTFGGRRCKAYPSFHSFVEDMAWNSKGDGIGSITYACQ